MRKFFLEEINKLYLENTSWGEHGSRRESLRRRENDSSPDACVMTRILSARPVRVALARPNSPNNQLRVAKKNFRLGSVASHIGSSRPLANAGSGSNLDVSSRT